MIVGSVIELAHGLGLRAVAEGVESPAALLALEELGCDLVQGYELAAPMPGDQLGEWMQARAMAETELTAPPLRSIQGGLEVA